MKKPVLAGLAALALAGPGAAHALGVPAATGYALSGDGLGLVSIADIGAPSAGPSVALTSGGSALELNAIAYRPQTRQLYGFSTADDSVYLVDAGTGMSTKLATSMEPVTDQAVGFDFNNVLDAARIVNTDDQNLVFFPNNMPPSISGAAQGITPLFYVAGDDNAGADPNVFANAYTNAVADPATTLQFVIDSELDILATLANNAGGLSTVGGLFLDGAALDVGELGGFDILSRREGDNTAYALLDAGAGPGIYLVPLTADADGQVNLTYLGGIEGGAYRSFAVAPQVPVPASALLLAPALGGLALLRRRRRA